MKAFAYALLVLVLCICFAPGSQADTSRGISHWTTDHDWMRGIRKLDPAGDGRLHSSADKADTVVVYSVDFEEGASPSFEGWVSKDWTLLEPKWHISTFNAESLNGHGPGNHAFWAGEDFGYDCGLSSEGYGNLYDEHLDWEMAIPNPAAGCTVNVKAHVNVDTQMDYDFLYLEYEDDDGVMQKMHLFPGNPSTDYGLDGTFVNYPVDAKVYIPAGGFGLDDTVHLRWVARSNEFVSDETCVTDALFGEFHDGDGHSQIDDVEVWFDQGGGYVQMGVTNTFEPGSTVEWAASQTPYVGDFAHVWDRLYDLDECDENTTPQVAFVDYGQNPGVGPSTSSWTYGPLGYVTNHTFGLSDAVPDDKYRLWNSVVSPVIEIDPTKEGHSVRWGAWMHFEMHGTAGMFMQIQTRSSVDGAIWSQWHDTGLLYGGPGYRRGEDNVTATLVPGARYAQISAGVYQPTWFNPSPYGESTPAPYYDDISWHSWDFNGPLLQYSELDLPHDAFPHDETGVPIAMDWSDLGNMDVPFDQGRDKVFLSGPNILHGDSVLIFAQSPSAGGGLTEPPWFHYTIKTNPVFDAYRTSGFAYTDSVQADTIWVGGTYFYSVWSVDLPDRDFLYPGDIMHYSFSATDTVNGGPPRRAVLPGDRMEHFGVFEGDAGFEFLAWPVEFTMRALPSVRSTNVGDVPGTLFWNDSGRCDALNGVLSILADVLDRSGVPTFLQGTDYDIFTTRAPDAARGNGLGAFCDILTLNRYYQLIYDAGDMSSATMTGAKIHDPVEDRYDGDGSNDIALIKSYLLGQRNLFAAGNNFIGSIENEPDGSGVQLVGTYFGVNWLSSEVRYNIGNQRAPVVQGIVNTTGLIMPPEHRFQADGACPEIRRFDAITPLPGTAESVAEFLCPDGETGCYPGVSAMVANNFLSGAKIVVPSSTTPPGTIHSAVSIAPSATPRPRTPSTPRAGRTPSTRSRRSSSACRARGPCR